MWKGWESICGAGLIKWEFPIQYQQINGLCTIPQLLMWKGVQKFGTASLSITCTVRASAGTFNGTALMSR